MFKKLLRKRGALSGVMFVVIMLVLVLLCVPSFRALMADNGQASENVGTQIKNITTP